MFAKVNGMVSPPAKAALGEEKLGCWRVWMPPRNSRKETRKRNHMVLGPYPLTARK